MSSIGKAQEIDFRITQFSKMGILVGIMGITMESSCRTIVYMGKMDIYKIHVGCPTRVLVK